MIHDNITDFAAALPRGPLALLGLMAALGLVGALLLTGCATQRAVQAEVQSYSQLQALPAPPTYRLELLPSQQAQAGQTADQ